MLWYEHETAAQRFRTRKTFKTLVCRVPMLILIRDLTLFNANRFTTRRTILHVYLLKTFATIGPSGFHKISLTAEQLIAVKAGKVSHVPRATLGFGALIREYNLVTCGTPWLVEFGVVTTTVDFCIGRIKKINKINEKLTACATRKTIRMPTGLRAGARCKYTYCAIFDGLVTLYLYKKKQW
jgi:hypothetical protein